MLKKTTVILMLLFSLAFAVRLGYNIFILKLDTSPASYYGADDGDYDAIGWNLASGKGYSITPYELTADRTPGYPLFLALVYKIAGHSYTAVRLLQSLLGALTCLFLFFIANRLIGFKSAVLASFIYSLYPFAVYYSGEIYTENLFIFFILCLVALLLGVSGHTRSYHLLICGMVLGFLTLIKPNMLMFFPFLAVWLFFTVDRRVKVFVKFLLLTIAGLMVIILPWFIRNYAVYKEVGLMRAAGGESILVANNDIVYNNFREAYFISPMQIKGVPEMVSGLNNIERDKVYMRLALDYIKNNPKKIAVLMCYHVRQLFDPIPLPKVKNRMMVVFSYGLLLPFMIFGFVISLKEPKRFMLVYFIIINFVLSAALFGGSSRYRQPIDPFLIIFAAYSFVFLWQIIGQRLKIRIL